MLHHAGCRTLRPVNPKTHKQRSAEQRKYGAKLENPKPFLKPDLMTARNASSAVNPKP